MMAPMAASLIASMASSLINSISRKGKGQEDGFLPLLALNLVTKAISGKGVKSMKRI